MSGASIFAINPEASQKVRSQAGLPDKLQDVQVNLNFRYTTHGYFSISMFHTNNSLCIKKSNLTGK